MMNVQTILLIDDDEAVRDVLARALVKAGYAVVEAADAIEGDEKCRLYDPDLVITDIVMPHADGLEFIFKRKPQERAMPIIAISGGGKVPAARYLAIAKAAGATAILEKPFELGALLASVGQLLGAPA